ncbi:hypothetical protein HYFRA_00007471 [Hymenoscyphus fraxineus]|uniref:Uncharacterized protein n=1 Tax=Hymenoscyphus fraxineus TaxID=746836 RepID=A0A9N9KSY6_9HELO|nr:hypothetical protein HYFRA_00007471 [Hymenoscyphus fraxineus]
MKRGSLGAVIIFSANSFIVVWQFRQSRWYGPDTIVFSPARLISAAVVFRRRSGNGHLPIAVISASQGNVVLFERPGREAKLRFVAGQESQICNEEAQVACRDQGHQALLCPLDLVDLAIAFQLPVSHEWLLYAFI